MLLQLGIILLYLWFARRQCAHCSLDQEMARGTYCLAFSALRWKWDVKPWYILFHGGLFKCFNISHLFRKISLEYLAGALLRDLWVFTTNCLSKKYMASLPSTYIIRFKFLGPSADNASANVRLGSHYRLYANFIYSPSSIFFPTFRTHFFKPRD